MRDLFINDFVSHYRITTRDIVADEYEVQDDPFEMADSAASPIVDEGNGLLKMHNVDGGMNVFAYERFINSCKKPLSFQNGRKRCDLVLTSRTNAELACLVEFTSTIGNTSNLTKPILNEDGSTQYAGGKMEKAEVQLTESLKTMLAVPTIAGDMNARIHRVCMAAYRIFPILDPAVRMRYPDSRYKQIEARETGEDGAIISMPSIESLGFEYRRVAYPTVVRLIK